MAIRDQPSPLQITRPHPASFRARPGNVQFPHFLRGSPFCKPQLGFERCVVEGSSVMKIRDWAGRYLGWDLQMCHFHSLGETCVVFLHVSCKTYTPAPASPLPVLVLSVRATGQKGHIQLKHHFYKFCREENTPFWPQIFNPLQATQALFSELGGAISSPLLPTP